MSEILETLEDVLFSIKEQEVKLPEEFSITLDDIVFKKVLAEYIFSKTGTNLTTLTGLENFVFLIPGHKILIRSEKDLLKTERVVH